MRETSSRSSIRLDWARVLRSIISRPRSSFAGSASGSARSRLRPTEERGERGAQLVRDHRQELVLQPVRLSQLGSRVPTLDVLEHRG